MRPAGDIRTALLQALCAGAVGTFDAIAAHAGVAPTQAQRTLRNLRYEGRVVTHRTPEQCARQGRPRVVYAAPDAGNYELDRLLSASWR